MFGKKKQESPIMYDKEQKQPAIKASICTGEKVAGFVDKSSGKFEELMLVRDERDIEGFCRRCGISPEKITKIW